MSPPKSRCETGLYGPAVWGTTEGGCPCLGAKLCWRNDAIHALRRARKSEIRSQPRGVRSNLPALTSSGRSRLSEIMTAPARLDRRCEPRIYRRLFDEPIEEVGTCAIGHIIM